MLPVSGLNASHQCFCFFSVLCLSLPTSTGGDFRIWIDDPQANYLVSIIDEFVDQPFQCILGIIVSVEATEKSSGPLREDIILVLLGEGEGCYVGNVRRAGTWECVEGDARLEYTITRHVRSKLQEASH